VNPQPTFCQRLFAGKWLFRLWFGSWSLAIVLLSLRASGFDPGQLKNWRTASLSLVITLLAAALGWALAAFPGCLILAPILQARARANGAPFAIGDTVQILSGPHSGTIAPVYSTWQGNQVRVHLGPAAADNYSDVFAPTDLLRVTHSPSEHSAQKQ
jgi:hypothetical protein